MSILAKLEEFIIENCERKIEKVQANEKITNYITNSVEFVKVIVEIEEYFGFTFENEDLEIEKFRYVFELVDFIQQHIEKNE